MRRDFSDLFDTGRPLIALSPMAGFSCVTYRGICHDFGADYAPTELTSARSIVMNGVDRSYRFMRIKPETEGVTCIQLFGNTPEDFTEAMKIICEDELLSRVDIFDINMGCPVQKVVKTGAGSGLIRTPKLACNIVTKARETAEALGKVLTVKTRIGYDESDKSGPEFARMLAGSGAQAICVHGRTAKQMYAGKADWEKIRAMRGATEGTGVYFFGNGDVRDGESARRLLEVTGADGLMIGRAACGNPWIFSEVKEYLENGSPCNVKDIKKTPSLSEKCDMLITELDGRIEEVGERIAVCEMRSVMPHYIKGFPGASGIKIALCRASTRMEVRQILDDCLLGKGNGV
ncbi:MAG: tRNA-dihydrouridine synthase [Clostridiales bacterium]|nr:tRNA-dihydrouridine synthase [Clostridiales bacterium]